MLFITEEIQWALIANQLNEKERWMVTSYVMKLKSELTK